MMDEMRDVTRWRPIAGYEGLYEVSSAGSVRSLARRDRLGRPCCGRTMKQSINNRWGYLQVTLHKDGKGKTHRVHQLVAHAFIGPQLPDIDVNHKDGNKSNNALTNLEYCTRSANILHALDLGLIKKRGEDHHNSKLTALDVQKIRHLSAQGVMGKDLASTFGVQRSEISRILTGKRWREQKEKRHA